VVNVIYREAAHKSTAWSGDKHWISP